GASPPPSPTRGRGSSKAGKEEKIPLKPRLEGKLSRIATLSAQGTPWGAPAPEVLVGGFRSVAFHPAREWLCACSAPGLVGVWNLEGVVGGQSRMAIAGRNSVDGDGGEGSGPGSLGSPGLVRPFAARVIAPTDGDEASSSASGVDPGNASTVAGGSASLPPPLDQT
ncbi:unnamed protein product, partial [Laminaria digitata]